MVTPSHPSVGEDEHQISMPDEQEEIELAPPIAVPIQTEIREDVTADPSASCIRTADDVKMRTWLNWIDEEGDKFSKSKRAEQESTEKEWKFPQVPEVLRGEMDSFSPSVVCIGPYHYRKGHLRRLGLKAAMASKFLKGVDQIDREIVFKKVEEFSRKVKKDNFNNDKPWSKIILNEEEFVRMMFLINDKPWGEIILNEEEFARMMFLDGCFILQFMYASSFDYYDYSLSQVMNEHFVNNVRRDLLLLRNQLPFQVLELLWSTRSRFIDWELLVYDYLAIDLSKFNCQHEFKVRLGDHFYPEHLLACFHAQFTDNQKMIAKDFTRKKAYVNYSANLRRAAHLP